MWCIYVQAHQPMYSIFFFFFFGMEIKNKPVSSYLWCSRGISGVPYDLTYNEYALF